MPEKETTHQKILIAGYYGYNNAGDEAILQGILTELRTLGTELEFAVLSGNPERTQALHNVNAITWSDIPGMVHAVKESSLVIVGGGGLIQDCWGVDESSFLTQRQGGMSEFGAPILLAKLFGIPSMFYAVGVGPLTSPEGKLAAKLLFETADRATVRVGGSKELLKEIGVKIRRISVVPDPAFIAHTGVMDRSFDEFLEPLEKPIIGVSLRYWDIGVEPPDWLPQVSLALDLLVDQFGGTIVFLPFQVSDYFLEDDEKVCIQVLDGMENKDRAIITGGELGPIQRFVAISQFDLVLGMRLHSLVGALQSGTPSVGLIYDAKVSGLLEAYNLTDYGLPMSGLDGKALAEKLADAFENKPKFEGVGEVIRKTHKAPSASLKYVQQ